MNLINILTYIIETPEVLVAGLFSIGYFIKSHIATIKERQLYIYKMLNQRFIGPEKTYKDLCEIKMLINDIPKYFNLSLEVFNAINNFSAATTYDINLITIANEYDNLILILNKQATYIWAPFSNKFKYKYQFNNIKQYHPSLVHEHETSEYKLIKFMAIDNEVKSLNNDQINFIQHLIKHPNKINEFMNKN